MKTTTQQFNTIQLSNHRYQISLYGRIEKIIEEVYEYGWNPELLEHFNALNDLSNDLDEFIGESIGAWGQAEAEQMAREWIETTEESDKSIDYLFILRNPLN